MVRPLRLEFAGALYHVIARGDRREAIFLNDRDRETFLNLLSQVCARLYYRKSNRTWMSIPPPRGCGQALRKASTATHQAITTARSPQETTPMPNSGRETASPAEGRVAVTLTVSERNRPDYPDTVWSKMYSGSGSTGGASHSCMPSRVASSLSHTGGPRAAAIGGGREGSPRESRM